MAISWRHHYIPQFFIKNFADKDGFLYLYDKEADRVSHKKFNSKQVFFEEDRNTVEFHGQKQDNLEHLFAELDNRFSAGLKRILEIRNITPEDLTDLVVFANTLKWRTTVQDDKLSALKHDTTIEDLNVSITLKGTHAPAEHTAIEHISNSDVFKETKRILLGLLPFMNNEKLLDIHNNSFINTNDHPYFQALLGDCGIIEKTVVGINQIENFIFPLSSTDTFIYKSGTTKVINNPLFYIQRNLVTIHLSKRYIICKDKTFLNQMVEGYRRVRDEGHLNKLTPYLFEMIA